MESTTFWRVVGVLGPTGVVACGAPGQDETHMIDDDPVTQAVSSDTLNTMAGGTVNFSGWDSLEKVEIDTHNSVLCLDDINLKT